MYRASIENEVGWPAFATEKGSSWAKHEVGCELTSAVRECSRQTSVLGRSVALWGCSRQANFVFNKLWQPRLGELPWENLPLSVVWDFTVYNLWYAHTHTCMHTHAHATHACTHSHAHARTHKHACTHKHTRIHTHAHMHARTHTHTHTHSRTHTHVRTHMHVRTWTHACTHSHTCMHAHTHTCLLKHLKMISIVCSNSSVGYGMSEVLFS